MAQQLNKTGSRISRAALSEFAEKGFDGANIARIAAAADVSQPNVHYHFRSKTDLWRGALDYLRETLARERDARRQILYLLSPLDQLKAASLNLIEQSAKSPVLGRLILSEGQAGGERLDWLLRHVLSDVYYEFLALIETCIERGDIKSYRAHHILMLLHGAAVTQFNVGPLTAALFGEDCTAPDNVKAFRGMYVDVIFSGLTLPAKDSPTCQD